MEPDVDYSLYRSDIFDDLIEFDNFFEIMSFNTVAIADGFGWLPYVSKSSMKRMHDQYLEDLKRVLKHGIARGSDELDHFKQAALICFWYRRTSPIHRLKINMHPVEVAAFRDDPAKNLLLGSENYSKYPCEITAFIIGARICMYFEKCVHLNKFDIDELVVDDLHVYDAIAQNMKEIGVILQSKNISFHSLYLIYKFLFLDISAFRK